MSETYTRQQFEKSLELRGIIPMKKLRMRFIDHMNKQVYCEDDFQTAFEWFEYGRHRNHPQRGSAKFRRMCCDGQNRDSMSNQERI